MTALLNKPVTLRSLAEEVYAELGSGNAAVARLAKLLKRHKHLLDELVRAAAKDELYWLMRSERNAIDRAAWQPKVLGEGVRRELQDRLRTFLDWRLYDGVTKLPDATLEQVRKQASLYRQNAQNNYRRQGFFDRIGDRMERMGAARVRDLADGDAALLKTFEELRRAAEKCDRRERAAAGD